MKKKSIFSIILILLLIIPSMAFGFVEDLGQNITPEVSEKVSDKVSVILGAIQWVGYAIAVGMLLYIGIKYMMAAANEKASLKQTLINYLIGAIIVFGVTTIFTITTGFFEDINGDTNSAGENTLPGGNNSSPVIGGDNPRNPENYLRD